MEVSIGIDGTMIEHLLIIFDSNYHFRNINLTYHCCHYHQIQVHQHNIMAVIKILDCATINETPNE